MHLSLGHRTLVVVLSLSLVTACGGGRDGDSTGDSRNRQASYADDPSDPRYWEQYGQNPGGGTSRLNPINDGSNAGGLSGSDVAALAEKMSAEDAKEMQNALMEYANYFRNIDDPDGDKVARLLADLARRNLQDKRGFITAILTILSANRCLEGVRATTRVVQYPNARPFLGGIMTLIQCLTTMVQRIVSKVVGIAQNIDPAGLSMMANQVLSKPPGN